MDGIANVFFTCGIRPQDVVAHMVGLPMVAGGLSYADGFRRIGATLAWLGGFPTDRVLTALPRLQASAILATTSFGVYLADHCRDLIGCTPAELGIKKFMSGGEPGLGEPENRAKISRAWDTSHIRECMGIGDVMSALWGGVRRRERHALLRSATCRRRARRSGDGCSRAVARGSRRRAGVHHVRP
jgi:phenylacetate-coenzyme A ligase PaaK-like adenylate-forming protein